MRAPPEKAKTTLGSTEVDSSPKSSEFQQADENAEVFEDGQHIDGFTKYDQKDMRRMGKKQELMRNFRRISAFSFTVILTATWEYLLIANTQGLQNGGLAGLWWSFFWTFIGFGLIIVSLAEMASMAPTTGGQYRELVQ